MATVDEEFVYARISLLLSLRKQLMETHKEEAPLTTSSYTKLEEVIEELIREEAVNLTLEKERS